MAASPTAGRWPLAGLVVGGTVVVVSFLTNAGLVLGTGVPTDFAWPIFGARMLVGIVSAFAILRSAR